VLPPAQEFRTPRHGTAMRANTEAAFYPVALMMFDLKRK
jgi:hypothetical protein